MTPPSTLCLLLRLVLIPSRASRLYLDPSRLQQSLLLLRGKKKVLIFGLKYWNGHGPFICFIFKVSQDSHLAAVHKIMQTDCNSQFPCSILDLRAMHVFHCLQISFPVLTLGKVIPTRQAVTTAGTYLAEITDNC